MAQLPPKVPNIMHQDSHHHNQHQQWQEYMHTHHQNHDDDHQSQNPPWVDEFIAFSEAKRGAHRRSVSDSSVAFVEAGSGSRPGPFSGRPSEITESGKKNNDEDDEFDKFDDEQFMSMFTNELGRCSYNLSSTSDHNSSNEDEKSSTKVRGNKGLRGRERVDDGEKAEEVESLWKFDKDQGHLQVQHGSERCDNGGNGGASVVSDGGGFVDLQGHLPTTVDPKRVKRILANRQSAQRSRVRKLQYISELERSVTDLQSEVSALSPRVAFLDHQRMILNMDNSTLKAKIAALAQDKIFKDAHQEAMKREIERLRQVYYQHNLNKITDSMIQAPPSSSVPPTFLAPASDPTVHENEHHND